MSDDFKEYKVNFPEFEPIIRALGIVALSWNHLEHALNDAIWQFANVDRQHGACITSQMIGPGPRVRAIASLMVLRQMAAERVNGFNSLAAEIETAGRLRNRYLHDQIGMHTKTRAMVRFEITADRKPKYQATIIKVEELHKLVRTIENLEKRLFDLVDGAFSAQPWPKKQYEQSQDISQLVPQAKGSSA